MNRKTISHESIEDARQASASSKPGAAPSAFDPARSATGAMATFARMAQWAQEVELAHREAIKACSAAIETATSASQRSPGSGGSAAALETLSQELLAALRDNQDQWMRSGAALQEDLIKTMREQADEFRALFRSAPAARTEPASSMQFDSVDAMDRARKSFDDWMKQWTSMFAPRPVAIS